MNISAQEWEDGLGQGASVYRFFDPLYNWDEKRLRAWLRQQDPDELENALRFFQFSAQRVGG